MKIAVISDIHSNPRALKRVIRSAKDLGCEKFICCGDVVGYGYAPNECIEICKENQIECIKGNHDAALVGELSLDWFNITAANGILANRPNVSEQNKKWLADLPYQTTMQCGDTKVVFSHGTFRLPEEFDYIDNYSFAEREMDAMRDGGIGLLFVGHTHGPGLYHRGRYSDEALAFREPPNGMKAEMKLERGQWASAIVNVGSVGYPRRCRFSTYAIFNDDTLEVEWIRLPFDYKNYCDNFMVQGREIPAWLKARTAFIRGEEE